MKVLKFGGTSVGTPDRIKEVVQIVSAYHGRGEVRAVVVSAFGGVTDQLLKAAELAAAGKEEYQQVLKSVIERHLEAARALLPPLLQSKIIAELKTWFNELEGVLLGVSLVKELSLRTRDLAASFGERLSAFIISHAANHLGLPCEYLDARQVVKTDSNFGSARVDFAATNRAISDHFKNHRALQMVTGFIASTPHDETTTLGRGGSDYSAAIFGAALGSSEIEIWTDVDGVMTADPRKVHKAFSMEALSYEEAMELSHFGAKVIHPPTMRPALERNIPLRIKNTMRPEFGGSIIGDTGLLRKRRYPITGVSSIPNIAMLRVEGSGMVGVAGISSRIFGALARDGISVMLITQASSEHTVCFAVLPPDAAAAQKAVEREFELEIQAGLINKVVTERELAVVSAVGENMRHTPGIAGRLCSALGRNGVNISAIAQGSSELNVSLVIDQRNEAKALNAIHDEFFLSGTKTLHVFILGVGLIGKTLLAQIAAQAAHLKDKVGIELKVVGLGDSKTYLLSEEGIVLSNWREQLSQGRPMQLHSFIADLRALNLPNSIFVDCTADPGVAGSYAELLGASISIVTPNKKAQTSSLETHNQIKQACRRGVYWLYETSVGAGLPVISTLNDLLRSGDEIVKIEAVLSGTLSYLFNSFDGAKPFSQLIREAKDLGLTEPDPRDDLSGTDVARKLLILARECGYKMELDDIEVESLVPEECRRAENVPAFFQALQQFDAHFEQRRKKAQENGRKLRYSASLSAGRAKVALEEVDGGHPFYGLSGSDNMISFTTLRYSDRPLVVRGPGAGAEVTAAGVFADIIRLGN